MLSDLIVTVPKGTPINSLNPCSNGICSLTNGNIIFQINKSSLNPCSNGICSLTAMDRDGKNEFIEVLILVLMEYAL